jgi:hypothetical protein
MLTDSEQLCTSICYAYTELAVPPRLRHRAISVRCTRTDFTEDSVCMHA